MCSQGNDALSTPSPAPKWAWWVATGFGSGSLKPARGTWGSLAALIAWLFVTSLTATPFATWAMGRSGMPRLFSGYGALEIQTPFSGLKLPWLQNSNLPLYYWLFEIAFLLLPILMTWLAIKASDHVVNETGDKDPGYIVADEWAGMWIALWPLRWHLALQLPLLIKGKFMPLLPLCALAFFFFRLFDIWKPWPARQIQDLPKGQGIVADDVVAGLYALVLTQLLCGFFA